MDFEMQYAKKQEDLLIPKKRQSSQPDVVRCITSFNERWRDMRDIMSCHWSILQMDSTIGKYILPFPLITYRRSRN